MIIQNTENGQSPKNSVVQSKKIYIKLSTGITLICIITIILIIFELYQSYRNYKNSRNELETLSDTVAIRLSKTLVEPVWNFEIKELNAICENEMQEKRVFGIFVYEYRGFLISAKKRDKEWNIIESKTDIIGDFVIKHANIMKKDEKIGRSAIYLTKTFLKESLIQEIIEASILILLLDTFLIISLIIGIRNFRS